MLEQEFTIVNKLGLHARASALLVKTASRYVSEIKIAREGIEVNGKSIMGIMMLAAGLGAEVELETEGDDEQQASDAIAALVNDKFGEGQ